MNFDRSFLSSIERRLGSSRKVSGALGVVLLIWVTLAISHATGPSETPPATPVPSGVASAGPGEQGSVSTVIASPSPLASPSLALAQPPLSDKERRQLLAEFRKAQAGEMAALRHRHRVELRELKSSQDARRKEWKETENNKRRQLFQTEAKKSTERRAYFSDRNARWDAFNRILTDELTRRKNEQSARLAALEEQQRSGLKEFQESLGRGERPSDRLWPGNN